MEGPFLDVVRGLPGLAGYSVQMAEPYVGDRDWRPDELEAYVSNGFTHPRVDVTLMMPADRTTEEWARTVHECLEGIWNLGQRMYLHPRLLAERGPGPGSRAAVRRLHPREDGGDNL